MINWREITPPDQLPVSLDEFKAHERIDLSDEDAHISGFLLPAAVSHVEGFLSASLITRTLLHFRPAFAGEMWLPRGPVADVTGVEYTDVGGGNQTLDTAVYVVDLDNGLVYLADGQSWPDTAVRHDAVRVTYEAGYGADADDVPGEIKAGILMVAGSMYQHRESDAILQGAKFEANPALAAILSPYRRADRDTAGLFAQAV